MSARKVALSPLEQAVADISHAVSSDITRETLNKPFGFEWRGHGYVAGTDGHRLAAVRCADWQAVKRESGPQAHHVIESAMGSNVASGFDHRVLGAARHFPAAWKVNVTFGRDGFKGAAAITVCKGKKEWRPFGERLCVDWVPTLEHLSFDVGVNLDYLLDAVDHAGTGMVKVLVSGSATLGKRGEDHRGLDPIVFLPYGADSLDTAERFSIVMPVRL